MDTDSVKIDLKLFAEDGVSLSPEAFIPVFHRWIQLSHLDDLLIDVADLSHVFHGPGVILVGHDAHYAIDVAAGRLGLLYSRRRETHPSLGKLTSTSERLRSVLARALLAAHKLEIEPQLGGQLTFRSDEVELRINDRLIGEDNGQNLRPIVEGIVGELYPDARIELTGCSPDDGRLGWHIRSSEAPGLEALLARIGAAPIAEAGSNNGHGAPG